MTSKNKKIEKLVGRIEDRYYVCDYVFADKKGFQGATASVLRPVGINEYEEAQQPENLKEYFQELWQEAVKAGTTEESLQDYAEEIYAVDGDSSRWDLSYYGYWDIIRKAVPELTEEDYPIFECVGGGRSFSSDMKWDEIYNQKIWELILEYENEVTK